MYPVRLIKILPVAALERLAACTDPGDRGLGPAASLIAAGRAQQQFDEFQNCVGKARQAQKILARRN